MAGPVNDPKGSAVEPRPRTWLQRSLLLIVIGMVVQLFCLVHVTPASFLIFAGFGAGPVVIGLGLFGFGLIRRLREPGRGEGQPDAD